MWKIPAKVPIKYAKRIIIDYWQRSKGKKEYLKYIILNTGVVYIRNRNFWLDTNCKNIGYILHTVGI